MCILRDGSGENTTTIMTLLLVLLIFCRFLVADRAPPGKGQAQAGGEPKASPCLTQDALLQFSALFSWSEQFSVFVSLAAGRECALKLLKK